jgi:hypothetical protein
LIIQVKFWNFLRWICILNCVHEKYFLIVRYRPKVYE